MDARKKIKKNKKKIRHVPFRIYFDKKSKEYYFFDQQKKRRVLKIGDARPVLRKEIKIPKQKKTFRDNI
jgi:hypothetical protein